MKKTISLFLVIVMVLSCGSLLVACGPDSTDGGSSGTCNHSYTAIESKATCTSGGYVTYQCSLCSGTYKEYESALGHTTTSGTCSRCGQTFVVKVWETSFYVDEFRNPTNEAYMKNSDVFIGVFSNSATTNSKLYARFLIDAEDIAVKLWEYGSQEVNAYSTTNYDITILDENGNKHYTNGTMYKNGDRIYFEDWTFVSLLQQNEKLKIYIEEDSKYGYKTTYLFEVKKGNFDSEYSSFYNNYMK